MNNAVFGKTMENLRNRVDISLIHNKKRLLKRISRSSFERLEIFNEDLAAVQCKKTVLKLNKPLSVGMTILELAKCIMYDHHYNHVMKKYGNSAKLMMTDTDSLLYHIKTEMRVISTLFLKFSIVFPNTALFINLKKDFLNSPSAS
jgi:hypothetical protein